MENKNEKREWSGVKNERNRERSDLVVWEREIRMRKGSGVEPSSVV